MQKENKSKTPKETTESIPKRKGSGSHGEKKKDQNIYEHKSAEPHKKQIQQTGFGKESSKRDCGKDHHTKEEFTKMTSKKQKIKRSDTIEEVGSAREMEEKLALNKALESMCNPLHTFECSEFSIKSSDGMSYGYGRLEVNPSIGVGMACKRDKRVEKRDNFKKNYEKDNRKEAKQSTKKQNEARSMTPNAGEKENRLDVVSPSHRETRSLTTSPHPNEPSSLGKCEKDFENTQSLVNIKDTQRDTITYSECGNHLQKDSNKYHLVDFSSSSLPASFSDTEPRDRNRKYKDDLVRSLTATPLSITGPENRVDLNYFSSRQWFASDATGQLSMSVRSVMSESQSSDNGPEDQGTFSLKPILDDVEIAGTPYRHPDTVRCTDTYVERLFNPEEKKKVRLRDTRAKARIKEDFCLFTS